MLNLIISALFQNISLHVNMPDMHMTDLAT